MATNSVKSRTKGLTQEQIGSLVTGQELLYNFGKDSNYLRARVKVVSRTASTIGCQIKVLQVIAHGGQIDTKTGDTFFAGFISLSVVPKN